MHRLTKHERGFELVLCPTSDSSRLVNFVNSVDHPVQSANKCTIGRSLIG